MDFAALYRRAGLTVGKLARLSGLSEATLHAWKRQGVQSKGRSPTSETLDRLADGIARHRADLTEIEREVRTHASRLRSDPPPAPPPPPVAPVRAVPKEEQTRRRKR